MGKAKKAENYKLVLPEKSWFLVAAAVCATVGLLLRAVGVSTERGEFIVGIPYFVNLQTANDSIKFIRYLGVDILSFAAGVLTIAAPLVRRHGLRLLAITYLFGIANTIWVYLTTTLNTASDLDKDIAAAVVIAMVLIGIIFVVFSCTLIAVSSAVFFLCDAGRLRNKKVLLIVVSVCLAVSLLSYVGNLFTGLTDYGSLSAGKIVLHKIYSVVLLLFNCAPTMLMVLSLEVRYEK